MTEVLPHLIEIFTWKSSYSMIVMSLLGPSLILIRNKNKEPFADDIINGITACCVRDKFNFKLKAVKELHSLGFIHCDIKPNNFVLPSTFDLEDFKLKGRVYLIDFGLC